MSKKIAICGTSRTTLPLAPFDDPTWEIWSLGAGHKYCPREDVHFELHDLATGVQRWGDDYLTFLATTDKPVWVQSEDPILCPNGVEFPLRRLLDEFGEYWTCSIAYMIGHAILEGAEVIGLYGADLAQGDEHAYQRPSVEYMVGIARGRGIEVIIPETSDILKTAGLYAYQTSGGGHLSPVQKMCEARNQELTQRQHQIEQQLTDLTNQRHVIAGARENMRWMAQHYPRSNNGVSTNGD